MAGNGTGQSHEDTVTVDNVTNYQKGPKGFFKVNTKRPVF
jgi:hypothetical protein